MEFLQQSVRASKLKELDAEMTPGWERAEIERWDHAQVAFSHAELSCLSPFSSSLSGPCHEAEIELIEHAEDGSYGW